MSIHPIYEKRLHQFQQERNALEKRNNLLTYIRLALFLGGLAISGYLFKNYGLLGLYAFIPFVILFIFIVRWHDQIKAKFDYYDKLSLINQQELAALDYEYSAFKDGADLLPTSNHAYAEDLDLFGEGSIYQYLNRTTLTIGEKCLADWLLAPSDQTTILARQAAIAELKDKIDWRQDWRAKGLQMEEKATDIPNLINWIKKGFLLKDSPFITIGSLVLPILMGVALLLTLFGIVTYFVPLFFWFINLAFIRFTQQETTHIIAQTANKSKVISTYQDLFECFEKETFQSKQLQQLQQELQVGASTASQEIKRLKQLSANLNIRGNLLAFLVLNTFFLWELIFCIKLEKWKEQMQREMDRWFQVLGEVEAFNSFANNYFNNPNWVMPEIAPHFFQLEAIQCGHPLLSPKVRISNDLHIPNQQKIILITGSNMAGKSTFLRTIGINLVLAFAGSPVCAKQFNSSIVTVYSSMRAKDSLMDSASSFFAELSGLKRTIDVVEEGEIPVFFLLDEILKGTNSKDRHQGSVALIRQLLKHNGVGLVSTHDLALCDMTNHFPKQIENWCFEVLIKDEEMIFDYTIKPGICRSMNATLLMKQMGIEGL